MPEHHSVIEDISSGVVSGGKSHILWWIIGIVAGLGILAYLRSRAAQPTGTQPTPQIPQTSGQDLSGLLSALQQSQQNISAINSNQGVLGQLQALQLGAETWLSCVQTGGLSHIDATCLKIKGAVGAPGTNVSNVKTENIGALSQAASAFKSCLNSDGTYNLTCVGYITAGSPTLATTVNGQGTQNSLGTLPITSRRILPGRAPLRIAA